MSGTRRGLCFQTVHSLTGESVTLMDSSVSVTKAPTGACLPVYVQLHRRKSQLIAEGWGNLVLVFRTPPTHFPQTEDTSFNFSFPSHFSFPMLTYSWDTKENDIMAKIMYLTKAEL